MKILGRMRVTWPSRESPPVGVRPFDQDGGLKLARGAALRRKLYTKMIRTWLKRTWRRNIATLLHISLIFDAGTKYRIHVAQDAFENIADLRTLD